MCIGIIEKPKEQVGILSILFLKDKITCFSFSIIAPVFDMQLS